jgi:hypothetical protein
MALTAEQEKELKQLKTINSPVPSQKKRILKLQQLKKITRTEPPKKPKIVPITDKYSLSEKGKPFVEKPKDDGRPFVRKLRSKIRKDQLAKIPKVKKKVPPVENKKKLTSGSVRKPTDRLKQVNINPPRANTSSATSVRKPVKKLKQPNANKKPKEQNKNKESEGFSFFTPKGRKLLNRIKKLIGPDKTPTTQNIKKALSSDGTYTQKQRDSLKEALKIRSPGHPSNRAKAPVAAKKVKPVVKTKVVKEKAKLKPTVKPFKAPMDKDQEEINKNVKADPRITAKLKAKPKSKVTAAEQKAADSFPQGMGRSLSKQEKAFADSRGGIKKFAPGKIEKGLAALGGGKMRGAVTALEDTFYSDIRDRMDKDGGEVSEYEKNYVKNFNTITNRKAKGGMVKRKYGGMVKRNMGGPAKPRKKTVFRRGGGQALRGFGKATYSNKLY